ncbi:MAG: hypothetical protein U1C49_01640 [Candidatus Andersenbacteria bacterium]|nr:hypothetical protein [Candidatus Andersenbacteria bacterium]
MDLAYACGLLATDGSLSKDGRHINLTSKDIEQLETFKRCLGLTNKIGWKISGYTGKMNSQVQFGNVVLYRWLVSIGIGPHKTKSIGVVRIPDEYFFDFLRGEFDGDGSSHAYWDTRWHSSVSLYIQFVCASKCHLEWLRTTVFRLIGSRGVMGKSRSIFQLKFAKTQALPLFESMYYSGDIPYLSRKKEKLDRQWTALKQSKLGILPEGFNRNGSIIKIA